MKAADHQIKYDRTVLRHRLFIRHVLSGKFFLHKCIQIIRLDLFKEGISVPVKRTLVDDLQDCLIFF